MNNQERIAMVLGWSNHEVNSMMHKAAFTWMRINLLSDEQINLLSKCKSFWQWWENEWCIRDGDYLWETSLRYQDEPLIDYELHIALEMYVEKHLVSRLTIQPNRFVSAELRKMLQEERAIKNLKQ